MTDPAKYLKVRTCRPITSETVLWRCVDDDDDFDATYLITRTGASGGSCDKHFVKEVNGKTVSVIVDVVSLLGLEANFRDIFFKADALIGYDMGEASH